MICNNIFINFLFYSNIINLIIKINLIPKSMIWSTTFLQLFSTPILEFTLPKISFLYLNLISHPNFLGLSFLFYLTTLFII